MKQCRDRPTCVCLSACVSVGVGTMYLHDSVQGYMCLWGLGQCICTSRCIDGLHVSVGVGTMHLHDSWDNASA